MSGGEFAEIEARWFADGGMGNGRSADDYTDVACRYFAEHGFRDVETLLAAVRERDNTIARAEAAVASAALKVLADFDTVMNVRAEVAYIVAEYNRGLRAALDPQETP